MSIEKLSGAARKAQSTGIQEADRGHKNLLLSIGDGVVAVDSRMWSLWQGSLYRGEVPQVILAVTLCPRPFCD